MMVFPMEVIDQFRGPHRFLSDFYQSPIELWGFVFPTAEHAFQAAKTDDSNARQRIAVAALPAEAKALGRRVELKPGWDEMRTRVMARVLTAKFAQHPELMADLDATGNAELIEGNTWCDQFWGSCTCRRHVSVPGQNWLGRLLMDLRSGCRQPEWLQIQIDNDNRTPGTV
jgi:ribA/ribD-fused uncharacterized protein